MEKFITLGDTAVRFADTERGEKTLLLLHGYLESLDVWDEFAALLSRAGYRVVRLDLPGHGISEVTGPVHTMEYLAGVAARLLEKLDIPKTSVVGHSMGGYVALALTECFPEKVESLVLFHSTPDADSEEKKEERRREIGIVKSGRKELLSRTLPGRRFAPENRKRMQDEIDAGALQAMLTEDEGIEALLNGMIQRRDRNDVLRKSAIPQLFVFGRGDELIPPDKAEAVIARNPQASVAWLEHSGHMGFLEEPVESLKIIEHFIPIGDRDSNPTAEPCSPKPE